VPLLAGRLRSCGGHCGVVGVESPEFRRVELSGALAVGLHLKHRFWTGEDARLSTFREVDLFERCVRLSGTPCGKAFFCGFQTKQHHVEHDANIDYDDEQAKPIWAF
jgi:hypothetical protein